MRETANRWLCFKMPLLAMAIVGALFSSILASSPAAHPNIILFYTDDQGWSDTSVRMMAERDDSHKDMFKTPNLQRLANEGMVFSDAYASSPVCSSSRDSILYGMTPARLHHSILIGKANRSATALTCPRAIKDANADYVTAHFGKWGCSPNSPEEAGFDVSDGKTNNWDGDWQMVDGKKIPLPSEDPKQMRSVTERANAFITEQLTEGRPFYLRISHYAVHVQHAALKTTVQSYLSAGLDQQTAVYAAMVENLDESLGSVLNTLDSLDAAGNTYVFFTSDNGGGFGQNGPLQGGKASLWEGGLRVPTVVRGPQIPASTYCNKPVVGWDFLPTFHDLAGGKKPLPQELDGGSLRPLLENGNRGNAQRNVQPLIFYYPWYDRIPMSVIRKGDFKLIKDLNTNQTRLFNLVNDLGETTDLSDKMPQLQKQMLDTMTEYLSEVDAEDLEELRAGREEWLRRRMTQDLAALGSLKAKQKLSSDPSRVQVLTHKIQNVQRRIKNNEAALQRVATGRELTAW